VDLLIADTTQRGTVRRHARGVLYSASAVDALIRAYEGIEAYNAANPRKYLLGGVTLRSLFRMSDPRGAAYVREVFETAEPPPVCEPHPYVTAEVKEGCGQGRRDPLWTPYCEAGRVLYAAEVDEARGVRRRLYVVSAYQRPDRPPEVRGVSEPAARWWSRCWDDSGPE